MKHAPMPAGAVDAHALRYLVVRLGDSTVAVTFNAPDDPVRSLPHRLRSACRLFMRSMGRGRRRGSTAGEGVPTFIFPMERWEEIMGACITLDMRLQALFNQPLSAKYVDILLGITGRERRRWAKDGRLPAVGHLMSSRTKSRFTVRLFSVDLVGELRRDPGLIARWRQEDAAVAAVGADMEPESNAPFVDVKT